MPRIATKITSEVANARSLLQAYFQHPDNTQLRLSADSSVPQPTISKFLNGRIKSLTPEVARFLNYANIGIIENVNRLTDDPRIQSALGRAWDGTAEGVSLIAGAIEALAPVIRGARFK
jgi:hypothetical protein